MFYETLKEKFSKIVRENQFLGDEITIKARVLKPVEAIGNPDRKDFPLLKGKEALMEATFGECKGQAFTDAPSEFSGKLKEIIRFDIGEPRRKALFVAALNAVMRRLYPDLPTIHCKDNEPEECAGKMVEALKMLHPQSLGIIGLQPAILDAFVNCIGADKVYCVDRDEENRGAIKSGVAIGWGDDPGMEELFKKSDIVLATGSTVVNGSLKEIINFAKKQGKPLYFYGTTIAGTAKLMNLQHLCFKAA